MLQQLAYLLAEERRDDGGRCLVGAQTVSVGGRHDAGLQQTVVLVNTHQRFHDERHEAQVLFGCLTRCMEQDTVVGTQTPVVMLTRAVDTIEGLLMQ